MGGDAMKGRSKKPAKKSRTGSSFESFLEGEGILEEVNLVAIKRVIAWQMSQAMERDGLSKTEMARRMHTSRAALDRLLDPENAAVTLHTIGRAASVLGKKLRVEII